MTDSNPASRAIVTGAGQGVGLAITQAMLAADMRVLACDLVTVHLEELQSKHPDHLQVSGADLRDRATPGSLVERATTHFGGVDVLVNNAAEIGDAQAFEDVDDDAWAASLEINLMAAVRCTRAAVRAMTAQGQGGSIVTIGSDAGELPEPDFAPYSVTKGALVNLSKLVSRAYGAQDIRANLISLGLTRTHATAGLLDSLREEHGSEEEGIRAFTQDLGMALHRIGEPEEVAALVLFLIGPGGRQVTGAMLRMDGGTAPTL